MGPGGQNMGPPGGQYRGPPPQGMPPGMNPNQRPGAPNTGNLFGGDPLGGKK
jgi:hypothetical protein